MTTNTGYKYISKTSKGFVVSLPPELQGGAEQRIQRSKLSEAIYQRNLRLGFDPDKGKQVDFAPEFITMPSQDLVRFGALGDTHLGSRYEALDQLNAFYDEMVALGVKTVFHGGNWVDGDKFLADVHTWGADNQIDYFIRNYPRRPGITTYILDGDDHEGWWFKQAGIVAGAHMEQAAIAAGRTDLKYLGYMEADVEFEMGGRSVRVKVVHGGGGSAKSISLASQNIIDSRFSGDEVPDIMLVGHYHKAHFLPNYRGCNAIQLGCFENQTPFMRGKNLQAHIGGWYVDVSLGAYQDLRVGATYLSYKPKSAWVHNPVTRMEV